MRTRAVVAAVALFIACGTDGSHAGARTQLPPQTGSLDQLLAPVALYPDQLLAQIVMSASDPQSVTKLDVWLTNNQHLKGSQLQDAAVRAGFEPSLVALALFPQVVAYMATHIDWTALLGQAFAADRNAVFASIQRLRHQAQEVGTLKTTPQQDVSTRTTSGGDQVIVIEPSNPQVVYVPQYNSQVVYTQPPATTTTTNVVVQQNSSADQAVAAGLIGFTAGIALGAAMDNNYYYGPYGWHGGVYMYNDAWDDYYDAREDAREDWQDHREDLVEERGDRASERSEQRTDRQQTSQQSRTERQQNRTENRPAGQTQSAQRSSASTATTGATTQHAAGRTGSTEARGYSDGARTQSAQRSSGGSDAFSGYSSGRSERASSARGQSSRSSAQRSRGGSGRRR